MCEPTQNIALLHWCRIGSFHFEWLQFYPDCGLKHRKSLFDGTVTNLLSTTLTGMPGELTSILAGFTVQGSGGP